MAAPKLAAVPPPTTHESAAEATLQAAIEKGARIPDSLRQGLLGVAEAWDMAAATMAITAIPQLAARMLEYIHAVQGLVPPEAPEDAFNEISKSLNSRKRVGTGGRTRPQDHGKP